MENLKITNNKQNFICGKIKQKNKVSPYNNKKNITKKSNKKN